MELFLAPNDFAKKINFSELGYIPCSPFKKTVKNLFSVFWSKSQNLLRMML